MEAAARSDTNDPIRVSKTAELIAEELRGRIARGQLKEGDILPTEQELVRQFAVSRPTLREAFRILETELLIVVRRGSRGGVVVSSPNVSVVVRNLGLLLQRSGVTLGDVHEARKVFEPAAVRMLATRRTKTDILDLKARVGAIAVQATEGTELSQSLAQAMRFHDLLMERCGNRTLAVIGSVLHGIVRCSGPQRLPASDQRRLKSQLGKTVDAFAKVTALIESGDADEAEKYWRQYLDHAGKRAPWPQAGNNTVIDLFADSPVLRRLSTP